MSFSSLKIRKQLKLFCDVFTKIKVLQSIISDELFWRSFSFLPWCWFDNNPFHLKSPSATLQGLVFGPTQRLLKDLAEDNCLFPQLNLVLPGLNKNIAKIIWNRHLQKESSCWEMIISKNANKIWLYNRSKNLFHSHIILFCKIW